MAQRVEILLEDDLDGSVAATTVEFALDRESYEIDLSQTHIDELRAAIAPWLHQARRTGGRRVKPPAQSPTRRLAQARTDPSQLSAMRSWANANGYEVSSRGQVSGKIQEAFRAAHQ